MTDGSSQSMLIKGKKSTTCMMKEMTTTGTVYGKGSLVFCWGA